MIKPGKLLTILLLCLVFSPFSEAFAELKVLKLKYSNPETMITTITQLFGRDVKVAAAPMINALVVNCDNPEILHEIEKLVGTLDRKPAMLRFSLMRQADSGNTSSEIRLGRNGKFSSTRTTGRELGSNSVVALEYRKARITDDSIRIFSYPSYWGETVQTLTISHGLMVSGHLTDPHHAQLEVWYSSGQELDSETLLTTLHVPLGQWIGLGGADNQTSQNSPEIEIKENSSIGKRKSGGFMDRHYLIKVDPVNN
ncbi:MAG: secretin N-terminal domain-containing protein [Candidatus Riflebacteria bacterium]